MNRSRTFRPDSRQFLAEHWSGCSLYALSLLLLGSDIHQVHSAAVFAAVWFTAVLGYGFWFFRTVRWEVNEQNIVFTRGIFSRETDYVELYRIVDYREEQNLLQQMFGIKTLVVYSGDLSHRSLRLYGLAESSNIVEFIRENVEKQKQKKKIYEITNR